MLLSRLLVVDDQTDVLKLVLKALGTGYDIRTAADGAEAYMLARGWTPDLVISDVNMPRMDGWTLIKKLRADPQLAFVPVIFLTSRSASEDHIRGFRLGADDYLDKSTNFWELPDRVTRALAKRQELNETVAPVTSKPSAGLSGRCDVIGLAALLTILEQGRRSGVLRMRRLIPVEEGLIFLVSGRVHRAEFRPRTEVKNREAIFELLRWSEGTFDFVPDALRTADDVEWTTAQLLIEGARRIDALRAAR